MLTKRQRLRWWFVNRDFPKSAARPLARSAGTRSPNTSTTATSGSRIGGMTEGERHHSLGADFHRN